MINDFFILQFLIIFVLLLCLFFVDSFFFIINSIIYLILISNLLWLTDLDIYVNFLIIIDLGVFFILIAFLINLSHLFQYTLVFNKQLKVWVISAVIITTFIINVPVVSSDFFNFLITFYNWFGIFNFIYFTDLQLMSDVYYVYTAFEFILMNFYIYFVVVILYTLIFVLKILSYGSFNTKTIKTIFMRYQNFQKQVNQTATVRVWSKKTRNRPDL